MGFPIVMHAKLISIPCRIDNIRPEDFDIKYRTKNRFRFMGNGRTKMVRRPSLSLATVERSC